MFDFSFTVTEKPECWWCSFWIRFCKINNYRVICHMVVVFIWSCIYLILRFDLIKNRFLILRVSSFVFFLKALYWISVHLQAILAQYSSVMKGPPYNVLQIFMTNLQYFALWNTIKIYFYLIACIFIQKPKHGPACTKCCCTF